MEEYKHRIIEAIRKGHLTLAQVEAALKKQTKKTTNRKEQQCQASH